jgi:hypothetical protein
MSSESEASVSLWQWVIASGGQTWLGVNDQKLWPWVAMRQLAAYKDMHMEAEESTALEVITKQWLVKTQQTEKT